MVLDGKIALVTGGAHRVGRATALGLAREGAGVVVHYGTSGDAAEETAEEIRQLGVPAWTRSADLRDPAAIDLLFTELRDEVPRLDVLVNSAASFESKPLGEISVEEWDAVLAINLRAPFLCLQRAAVWMRESRRPEDESGLVVNLADLAGVQAWVGFAHHGVSKAGLIHLTRQAARELAPAVRVNAVVPGPILPPPGVPEDSESWRGTVARLPLQRAGRPELIARTVVYFADNDFITGAVVPVDGGESLVASRDAAG